MKFHHVNNLYLQLILCLCLNAQATEFGFVHSGSSSSTSNKVKVSQKWNKNNKTSVQVKSGQSRTTTTYDSKSSYFKLSHRYKFDNSDSMNAFLKTSDEYYNFKTLQTGFDHTINFEDLFNIPSKEKLTTSFQWGLQMQKYEHTPTSEDFLINEIDLNFTQDLSSQFTLSLDYYKNFFQSKSYLISQGLNKISTSDSDINSTIDSLNVQGYSLNLDYFADSFDSTFSFSQDQSYITGAFSNTFETDFTYTAINSWNFLLGLSFTSQRSTNSQSTTLQLGVTYFTD